MSGPGVTRLRPHELARMRQTGDRTNATRIHLYRRSDAKDSRGGTTQTLAPVASFYGRMAPYTTVQATEAVFADTLGGAQGWWFTLTDNLHTIYLDDQLRSGNRRFEVVGFDTGRTWRINARILCREIT